MTLFIWTDAFATGDQSMDDEHRRLINLVNAVLESIANCESPDHLRQSLSNLVEYTRAHFGREEVQMLHIAYPGIGLHSADHAYLLLQIEEVKGKLELGEKINPMALYLFLTRWVKDHILQLDMKLVAALRRAAGSLDGSPDQPSSPGAA